MNVRRHGEGIAGSVLAASLIALTAASPALGATTVGAAITPPDTCTSTTVIQTSSPGGLYTVPSAGVITSWSHQAAATLVPDQLRFKVARPAGGSMFTIVGESAIEAPVAGALNTYPVTYPVRIAVQPGDVIGFFSSPDSRRVCRSVAPAEGFEARHAGNPGPDVPAGTTTTFFGPFNSPQLAVSASLEPDADNDGYGDETQDQCPTDASKQDDCAPPDTTITLRPKDKTRKKVARIEFSSSEPSSSFECSLDGAPFGPCTSPTRLRSSGQAQLPGPRQGPERKHRRHSGDGRLEGQEEAEEEVASVRSERWA